MKTAKTFGEWLGNAKVGDKFVYHSGFLGKELEETKMDAKRGDERAKSVYHALCRVKGEAMRAYELELVDLVQKRLGKGVFDYIAVRRRKAA